MPVDRSALKALGALAAAGVLALAGAEAVLGAFYPQERMSSAYVDRWGTRLYIGHANIRHRRYHFDVTYHTNALGFRGPDRPFEKPAGTARIVVLGASFVFGSGVANGLTYGELLEAKLNAANLAKRFEVVNLGAPGTPLAFHELLYRDLGRKYSPDVVVVHAQLNGVTDLNAHQFARQDYPMESGGTGWAGVARTVLRNFPGYAFLCENSHLWALKRKSMVGRGVTGGNPAAATGPAAAKEGPSPEEFAARQRGYLERLDAIASDVCASGGTTVVLRAKDHFAPFPLIDSTLDAWDRARPCVRSLEVSVTPDLIIAAGDPHWNEKGQEAAASALAGLLAPRFKR
ncbi:SGNH/GDSL hydrolase family protein [bacterium]|nr:MAG: SGNH/GDSL hydrolase family protein [bacterium]